MRVLDYSSGKRPVVRIIDCNKNQVDLVRKRVPIKNVKEHDLKLDQITKRYEKKKIDHMEYVFQTIEHMCDEFDRASFDDLDVYDLMDILEAIRKARLESAAEKKTI